METPQALAPKYIGNYVLGLDVGSASLGWALIQLSNADQPVSLIRAGVRIFEPGVDGTSLDIEQGKDQSKAVDRRTARLHRRQLRRRAARQRDLFALLQRVGLLPAPKGAAEATSEQRHAVLNALDNELALRFTSSVDAAFAQMPLYQLRKRALYEPLDPFELGRVFVHLSQRRGFLSNRKDTKKSVKDNEDLGQVKADIHALEKLMQEAGAQTLGEYLAGLDPHKENVRRRWTARSMFKDEFEKIWASQQPHRVDILTPELHDQIAELLYFQRPISSQSHLIGKCELEPDKQRAPWATMAAQRFRILQKVNDLRLIVPGHLDGIPLTPEQRTSLFTLLDREGDQSFANLRNKHLGVAKGVQFNLEREDEKSMRGNRTQKSMLKVFGERWDTLTEGKQNQIIENWRNSESDDLLKREAIEHLGLDEAGAQRLLDEKAQPDYCALSLKAIEKLLPLMQAGKSFKEAETEVYGSRFTGENVYDFLPPVRDHLTSLRNPAVERALTEMRKVVNAIVREFGKPYEIRIELARELKKPRQERVKATKDNIKRRKEREDVARRIVAECGLQNPSRPDIEKALLHMECGGICPYTGRSVPFSDLFHNSEFDVEHIIPRSRFPDDSFQNKTLCYSLENRQNKRHRTPFEAYSPNEELWAQILQRVRSWPIPNDGKLKRFLLSDPKELEGFSARQMNDTRYTSVLTGCLLETLYGGRDVVEDGGTRQVIFASSGKVTATLRRSWGLEGILQELVPVEPGESRGKPRVDHRHHAIDAITIALTRQGIIQAMAEAASLEPWQEGARAWRKIVSPWKNFVDSIRPHVEQMVVSHRPEHKLSGELHKGTNYSRPYIHCGKQTVHTRCALATLSTVDIDAEDVIVDAAVREAVRAKLEEIGGNPKLFEKPENTPYLVSPNGRAIAIRKVRIRETKNPLTIGSGARQRFVASGGIHHVVFFVTRDQNRREKWDSTVVQITEAYERRSRKQPVIARTLSTDTEARFLFSVMKDDIVQVTENGVTRLLRVKKFGENKQIWFVPINDAHDDANQKKLGITWSKKPNTLKDLKPQKVAVDLLGRVHPAND